MNGFKYKADYLFFLNNLADGNVGLFKKQCMRLFDFRAPSVKRAEFNKVRIELFQKLIKNYGLTCQLQLCADCSKVKKFDVDHYIPLSTNELNKKLRGLKPAKGKKVLTQSFGSNHIDNLRIACKRCNAFKKHRIII